LIVGYISLGVLEGGGGGGGSIGNDNKNAAFPSSSSVGVGFMVVESAWWPAVC